MSQVRMRLHRRARNHESADWDAVLKFLPIFEQPLFEFGHWYQPEGQFGYYEYSPEVLSFIQALHDASVTVDFAWTDWQPRALQYWEQPSMLDRARASILRKLLSLHLRKDRFVEGHLASMLESGHITAILRRAKHLTRQHKLLRVRRLHGRAGVVGV